MGLVSTELVALLIVVPVACASTMEQRRDYILAHPHGWVEVTIEDDAVPQVPAAITAETEITIEAGRVTELQFDGIQLRALPPRDDSAVTLEDIYEAVTGKPKAAR